MKILTWIVILVYYHINSSKITFNFSDSEIRSLSPIDEYKLEVASVFSLFTRLRMETYERQSMILFNFLHRAFSPCLLWLQNCMVQGNEA